MNKDYTQEDVDRELDAAFHPVSAIVPISDTLRSLDRFLEEEGDQPFELDNPPDTLEEVTLHEAWTQPYASKEGSGFQSVHKKGRPHVRVVVHTRPGVVELAYTWLPTWIGINTSLKKEIETALSKKIVGRVISEKTLDDIHDEVIDFLAQRFPNVDGLRDYLDSLKFISLKDQAAPE